MVTNASSRTTDTCTTDSRQLLRESFAAVFNRSAKLPAQFEVGIMQYQENGRWITIGGGGENGGKGTHVKVDGSGNILAGPKALTGKSLDSLSRDDAADDSFELRKPRNKESVPKPKQQEAFDRFPYNDSTGSSTKHDLGSNLGPSVRTMPDGRKIGQTMLGVDQIGYDPGRFQYKVEGVGTSGVSDKLKDVRKFKPEFAGQLLGWYDPSDGKVYVVNGHHRYELAQRTGYDGPLSVFLIDAKDAKDARSQGALANIAAGHGTSLDAAKFIRETSLSTDDLQAEGVSIKDKVAEEGTILAKLSDNLFGRIVNNRERAGIGLAIARHVDDHEAQDRVYKDVQDAERRGRNMTEAAIEEMAKEESLASKRTETQHDLFGSFEQERSLRAERGILKAAIRRELSGRARAFTEVSRRGRSETLAEAGNVLDDEQNKRLAQESNESLYTFDKLANYRGEISDAINQHAEQLADNPKQQKRIVDSLLRSLRAHISEAESRGSAPHDGELAGSGSDRESYGLSGRRLSVAGRAVGNGGSGVLGGLTTASLHELVLAAYSRRVAEREEANKQYAAEQKRDDGGRFASTGSGSSGGAKTPFVPNLDGWNAPRKKHPSLSGQRSLFAEVDVRTEAQRQSEARARGEAMQRQLFQRFSDVLRYARGKPTFREEDHPRDPDGKFVAGEGGGSVESKAMNTKLDAQKRYERQELQSLSDGDLSQLMESSEVNRTKSLAKTILRERNPKPLTPEQQAKLRQQEELSQKHREEQEVQRTKLNEASQRLSGGLPPSEFVLAQLGGMLSDRNERQLRRYVDAAISWQSHNPARAATDWVVEKLKGLGVKLSQKGNNYSWYGKTESGLSVRVGDHLGHDVHDIDLVFDNDFPPTRESVANDFKELMESFGLPSVVQ